MKCLYIVFVCFFLFFSCKNEDEAKLKEISNYIKNDLKSELNINDLYILIPLINTCHPCLKSVQDYLLLVASSDEFKNIHLIFIGNSRKEIQFLSEKLQNKFDIISDHKGIGLKKGIVKNEFILVNMKSENSKIFHFTIDNNYDKMKAEIASFIRKTD